METFEESGFLSDDNQIVLDALESDLSRHLAMCHNLNKEALRVRDDVVIISTNDLQVISSLLYCRVITSYQAAMLLSYKGMKHEVYAMLRCMLESLFPLVAMSKDHSVVQLYVYSYEAERLKITNKLIRTKIRDPDFDFDLVELETLKKNLKKDIDKNNFKSKSTFDYAVIAGLEDMYDILYTVASGSMHVNAKSIEEDLIFENGILKGISQGPSIVDFEKSYCALVESLCLAITAYCEIFEYSEPRVVNECRIEIDLLHPSKN